MAARRIMPDQAYLQACFRYDESSGALFWRRRPLEHFKSQRAHAVWNGRYSGKEVGCVYDAGKYRPVTTPYMKRVANLDNKTYVVARLIFKLVNGYDPFTVDHANVDSVDNRTNNMRDATAAQNGRNRRVQTNNKTGLKGASWNPSANRFVARIKHNGKSLHLGCFLTAQAAHDAYCDAARRLYGEFARY